MAVATGEASTFAVAEDGTFFAWGQDNYGEVGIIHSDTETPRRVSTLPSSSGPVRQVSVGGWHTGIVTEVGNLFMCGRGSYGRLGLGNSHPKRTPTLVGRAAFDGDAVLMVACGAEHTAVVTEGGNVYTFGRGEYGRLGHGDNQDQLIPRRIPAALFNGEQVVMVAAGMLHTVALTNVGHVFTWGHCLYGQLGHGNQENQSLPQQVEPEVFATGEAPFDQDKKVVFVSAGGGHHTNAVTSGGRLYTWGLGFSGNLGHGDTGNRLVPTPVQGFGKPGGPEVAMTACGVSHTLVVTQDGALWACGRGDSGQLGLNDDVNRTVFERVGGAEFQGVKVVAAVAGYQHSAAVTEDGALWTWGNGNFGRLGHGGNISRLVPTRVPLDSLGGLRIGRCRVLPKAHAFAFLMGTKLLDKNTSNVKKLAGEMLLVPMICSWCAVLPGMAGRMEGLMRLCGGFHAWRQQRVLRVN